MIRALAQASKTDEGHSARLTAGLCWPSRNSETDNFWASESNGLNQVGCVYTARNVEFDYVGGIIWGRDLRWDPATNNRIGRFEPLQRLDSPLRRRLLGKQPLGPRVSPVKRSAERFTGASRLRGFRVSS